MRCRASGPGAQSRAWRQRRASRVGARTELPRSVQRVTRHRRPSTHPLAARLIGECVLTVQYVRRRILVRGRFGRR